MSVGMPKRISDYLCTCLVAQGFQKYNPTIQESIVKECMRATMDHFAISKKTDKKIKVL